MLSLSNLTWRRGGHYDLTTTKSSDKPRVLTGEHIKVNGSISATLQPGQMTGVNGLLSSTGVHVGVEGASSSRALKRFVERLFRG